MSGRRHHEVAPGGDGETNRNHYEGVERKENRRNRVEKRQAAREHFRNERSEIREEIDMTRAGLAKRLHVQLATVEMLRVQLKEESIGFELPDNYEAIQGRIEKLANGSDNNSDGEALYEGNRTKGQRRTSMKNDLQVLRLTARGLRSSLRRHVNHIEEPEAPESDVPPAIPPVNSRPPSAPSAPRESIDLEDKKDEEGEKPDEEEADGSDDPEPAVVAEPTVVEGTPDGTATVPTPEVADEGDEGDEDEVKDVDEDEDDDEKLTYDPDDPLTDPYLGTDVAEVLKDDYEIDDKEIQKYEDPKFKQWLLDKYEMSERQEIISSLENGGKDSPDGLKPLEDAYKAYEKSLAPAELPTEKVQGLLEDKVKELNISAGLGLTSTPVEGGVELSIPGVENKIKIILGSENFLHIQLPTAFRPLTRETSAIFELDTLDRSILDARRLLREIAFIESNLYSSPPEAGYESNPYTVNDDGKTIDVHRKTWWNPSLDWSDRGGQFQASAYVDIHLVTEALNNYYFEKNTEIERPAMQEVSEADDEASTATNKPDENNDDETKLTITDEIAKERDRFINTPNAVVTESENGFTAKVGKYEISALKTGETWNLSFPEELNGLVNRPFNQHTDSLAELAQIFQDASVLMNAYNIASTTVESSINRDEAIKHGGPLYLKDTWTGANAIRVSEDYTFFASTLGVASDISKTKHSDLLQFVQGFNEDYLEKNTQLKAEIKKYQQERAEHTTPPDTADHAQFDGDY